MEKKEIEISHPVTAGGVTLIPITKTSLNFWYGKSGLAFFGVKQPFNVVVVSPSAKKAFGISGEEVRLDQLITEVPGLKELLARI
jgi:hypothetical protein